MWGGRDTDAVRVYADDLLLLLKHRSLSSFDPWLAHTIRPSLFPQGLNGQSGGTARPPAHRFQGPKTGSDRHAETGGAPPGARRGQRDQFCCEPPRGWTRRRQPAAPWRPGASFPETLWRTESPKPGTGRKPTCAGNQPLLGHRLRPEPPQAGPDRIAIARVRERMMDRREAASPCR